MIVVTLSWHCWLICCILEWYLYSLLTDRIKSEKWGGGRGGYKFHFNVGLECIWFQRLILSSCSKPTRLFLVPYLLCLMTLFCNYTVNAHFWCTTIPFDRITLHIFLTICKEEEARKPKEQYVKRKATAASRLRFPFFNSSSLLPFIVGHFKLSMERMAVAEGKSVSIFPSSSYFK